MAGENLFEEVDIQELQTRTGVLPPLPETEPEYNENVNYNASSEKQIMVV